MMTLSKVLGELAEREDNDELLQQSWETLEVAWESLREKCNLPEFERWPAASSLSPAQLDEYGRLAERNDQEKVRGWMFDITLSILRHFLGENWVKKYLFTSGPLKPPFDSRRSIRAVSNRMGGFLLAEMLFNLQHEEGFEDVRQRLAEGNIESVISELEAARFLKMNGEKFRFVKPSGQKARITI